MSVLVSGQLVDGQNKPIEFAVVYTSDSSGKPLPNSKNAQTDDKGKWVLNGVGDNDYITARLVGFNQKTIPVKSIVPIMISGFPVRMTKITLSEDVKTILEEAPIFAKKVVYKEKKLGKYIAIASAGLLLITITTLVLNKKLIK
jgi:hypothetical protein